MSFGEVAPWCDPHGEPHRTDPFFAAAYNTIIDLFRFCFNNHAATQYMCSLWPQRKHLKFSLVQAYDEARTALGIKVNSDLPISFADSGFLPLGRCAPQDVAATLRQFIYQAVYEKAFCSQRKDFLKPQGLIDMYASTAFLRKPTFETSGFPTSKVRAESTIVGRTLTRDRLFAAGWTQTSNCRFCDACKETLHHLAHELATAWDH